MTMTYSERDQLRDLQLSGQADEISYHFQPTRREFVQVLGAGIMIAVASRAWAQGEGAAPARGGRGRGGGRGGFGGAPVDLAARLHIGKDGAITVLSGKVECGQGSRAEITLATAEELGVAPARVSCILGDTTLCPNDGGTYGSQTTPRTIPPIRQAASAAKQLLIALAAKTWNVDPAAIEWRDGVAIHTASNRKMTLAEMAANSDIDKSFASAVPANVRVSPVSEWKVLGHGLLRPNARDIVMGKLPYPSDLQMTGMVYGKVLRAPAFGAKLVDVDLSRAKALPGVAAVRDGEFVGVTAPTMAQAEKALDALVAKWSYTPQPKSSELADYLRKNSSPPANRFTAQLETAAKRLKASYFVPYIQHAPMEPRAAVAQWQDGKVTVWTGSQDPMRCRQIIASAFRLPEENVRVIINDFGGAFGGKHTPDAGVEAARLAQAAGKPVSIRWTREEEFTWAQFRPAGVIDCEASLDSNGKITSWYFININSGPSAVQTPYTIATNLCQTVPSEKPLRESSYRGLAATANAWARECFMDELAAAAGKDPLEFRLIHLEDERLKAVLETVAKRFDFAKRSQDKAAGIGIACATEKGSYTATCASVTLERANSAIKINEIAHVFECGKILNPPYLTSQVQGAIIQGLGPILREAMEFEDGRMLNASFADYKPPRFADVPRLDVFLLDRPDIASAGAGETPLISVAPAVTNAVCRALGGRLRQLPLQLPGA